MTIKKIVNVKYIDDQEGFEYQFQPVNDEVTIIKSGRGKKATYKAGYLVQDDDARGPDEDSDNNLFLVHYHRDFEITRDKIITQNDARNWYRKDYSDYEDEDGNAPDCIPQAKEYWIFPVAAYIHSGVYLYLAEHKPANVYLQHEDWDTSHVGLVLVAKSEWPDENKALNAAKNYIEAWNQYLSGDVYGIVIETYDADKKQTNEDSCWGYYGYEETKQELKRQMEG